MLGLGLRLARPAVSPRPFFATAHCLFPSRSLLHLAATSARSSSLKYSRILTLAHVPRTFHIRHASLWSNRSFPSVHSIAEVTKAEAEADSDPNNLDAQVRLFRLLVESARPAGWKVLMTRWERMCEFVSSFVVCLSLN